MSDETEALIRPPSPRIASLPARPATPLPEPKICWICQQDETEDTPQSTPWRKPCPCSLDAHDDCLLEWVTAEEAPKKGELAQSKKLKCPQCGTEIKVQRPRDIIVSLTELTTRISKNLVVPTGLGGILACTYSGLWLYGYSSMNLVFGVDETRRIFGYAYDREIAAGLSWLAWPLSIVNPFYMNRASKTGNLQGHMVFLYAGLPLVAPSLVLFRTKLLDQATALVLPVYFLLSSRHRNVSWPPSAGLTFAVLPYIRSFYNELYRNAFGELEKKWEYAVQRKPREGETAEQIAALAQEDDHDAIIGLEIGFDEEEENPVPPPAQGLAAGNLGGNAGVDAPAEAAAPAQRNNNRGGNNNQWNIEENISTSRIASTIMGALFFPAISSVMGSLLKNTLPRSWLGFGQSRGLLKEQWGRSIVGGCLFVVLKDAVLLYCKWKKARDFGKRKVLDWVPPKNQKMPKIHSLGSREEDNDEIPALVPVER